MSCSRPSFLVRNNNTSSYFFRSIIPLDLRSIFNNTREFRLSLKTGILSEARMISAQLKFEADNIFDSIRCGNSQKICVFSIKERLKARRDSLLLTNMKGGDTETEKLTSTRRKEPPYESSEKMKLSEEDLLKARKLREEEEREEGVRFRKALKLVKAYYYRFSYEEIMEFCKENDIDVTEELFPKRYVRKCRQSAVKFLEDGGHILEEAEDIAREVIEERLDSLSRKKFLEFFSKLGIKGDRFEGAKDKKDMLDLLEVYVDMIKLAYETGVGVLFEDDDGQEEEETTVEKEAPNNAEENYDILCDKWENKYQPPPAAVETTPEIDQHQVMEQSVSAPDIIVKTKILKLSEVVKDYFTEIKTANQLGPKTLMEKELVIGKFIEITGDLRVDDLSSEVARNYKQTLMRLPANMRKDKRYRNLRIEKILQLKDVKPISVTTVNNNLAVVITFMNWAKRNRYIGENYFEGLKLPKHTKAQDDRKPFSEEDIKAIFHPDTYPKAAVDKPSRYWVPLLALFTGARLNELCQLHVDDVIEKEGIWCLSINDNSEDKNNPKKLKNSASERLVPLHKTLVELGFLEHVRKQRESNHIRLFPELSHGIDGFSKQTSKWFNESYLRKTVGIKDKKKTFHSFRHTVADGLKQQARVSESYISELLGHSSGKSETFGRYGKSYQPKVLMEEAVSKISYEGLELGRYEK